jgi:hypothetical protein
MEVEEGPPIVKAASNLRSYKLIKLRNGLAALLIHDPEVDNDDNPDEEGNDGEAAEDMDVEFDVEEEPDFPFDWPHFQYNCTGTHFPLSVILLQFHSSTYASCEG